MLLMEHSFFPVLGSSSEANSSVTAFLSHSFFLLCPYLLFSPSNYFNYLQLYPFSLLSNSSRTTTSLSVLYFYICIYFPSLILLSSSPFFTLDLHSSFPVSFLSVILPYVFPCVYSFFLPFVHFLHTFILCSFLFPSSFRSCSL